MGTIHRAARVPYSATQMFDLVNDVERYPEFLHWCRSASIDRRDEQSVEATLDIGMAGVHKRLRTRNRFERPERIDIELLDGPFRHLDGAWLFKPLPEGGCDVEFTLRFEMASSPLSLVFTPLFEEIARAQVNAFAARAGQIYG